MAVIRLILGAAVALLLSACAADWPSAVSTTGSATTLSVPHTTEVTTVAPAPEPVRSMTPEVSVEEGRVTVDVAVQGFEVRFVRLDRSGETAHLHLYIDREPPSTGEVVPLGPSYVVHSLGSQVVVDGLARGPHTLWLVAADGEDRVLNPPEPIRIEVEVP